LAAPERGERVRERQLAARVVGDVREREVARAEGIQQDERGDGVRGEGADERVSSRLVQAPAAAVGGEAPGDRRVQGEAEGEQQSRAAEVCHTASLATYHCRGFVLVRLRHIPLPTLAVAAV